MGRRPAFGYAAAFSPQAIEHVSLTWFHGIRARIFPIPQVSVIPAKTSSLPTKATNDPDAGVLCASYSFSLAVTPLCG